MERQPALDDPTWLRDRLTEAEAAMSNAQDALDVDHPVWWILDNYDGSMDSVKDLARARDQARELLSEAWEIICNVDNDFSIDEWANQTVEWKKAAMLFRERYHKHLKQN